MFHKHDCSTSVPTVQAFVFCGFDLLKMIEELTTMFYSSVAFQ